MFVIKLRFFEYFGYLIKFVYHLLLPCLEAKTIEPASKTTPSVKNTHPITVFN